MHPQITHTHKERQKIKYLQDDGLLCAPHLLWKFPVFFFYSHVLDWNPPLNAVIAVHVPADVPEDHIEDEEYGEDEERY